MTNYEKIKTLNFEDTAHKLEDFLYYICVEIKENTTIEDIKNWLNKESEE